MLTEVHYTISHQSSLTLLQFISDCSLHELDSRVPLLLVMHRPIFQRVDLNHSLITQTTHVHLRMSML